MLLPVKVLDSVTGGIVVSELSLVLFLVELGLFIPLSLECID